MRVYIYGRGLGLVYVNRCLQDNVDIIAYIDNYSDSISYENGIPVIRKKQIDDEYDYILISIMKYHDIKGELIADGVKADRIICFFDMKDAENQSFFEVMDPFRWKTELMWKYTREVVTPTMSNMYYESNAQHLIESRQIPLIIEVKKTIDTIINYHKSLTRFGDGEFEIMAERPRPRFQVVDKKLNRRLREVISSDLPELLVAIANNYGSLKEYTDDAANGIRSYLTQSVRQDHMSLLDMDRIYYDAYLSRPYIMYRDKRTEVIQAKFDQIKMIWDKKKILIVEGMHTRFGVGNDLIDNAFDVIRILAPDRNAFSVYNDILKTVKKYGKDRLVLCSLGPTATVLAYDLARMKYWVIDIGQVDTEYEWFLRGVTERCDIPYKTVSEYADKKIFDDIEQVFRSEYEKQIVAVIEG